MSYTLHDSGQEQKVIVHKVNLTDIPDIQNNSVNTLRILNEFIKYTIQGFNTTIETVLAIITVGKSWK